MTKAKLYIQKQNLVQRAITAAMHILHDSFMFGTPLWPKRGFNVGWYPEKMDCIMVGARIDEGYGVLVLNLKAPNYTRITKQCKAIELIMSDAIYEDILFTYIRGGYHHHHLGNCTVVSQTDQLIFGFSETIQQ
ncbi:hypothetical protein ACHMWN_15495 [Pedobacter sp. UC225_61]|uniref:hypothetical protein n=1 Tax=Pedobacter sp. UC225_61 TaxID=3374623 RepID=UPI0037952343